ncbi:helix-turn-helix domain-containing protein [uncultured Bacteroides sp.]|uniref:helix-turn-helix domain-containing protein n=1 Tax=uncultured Bacteroides sp. TaxID=162156 RepID=UPI002AAA7A07|nr:helix-turn-helix domain-containing protein [uncultured Bacteroides sp.]
MKELEDKILNTINDNQYIRLIESFLINCLNPFKEYNYKRMVTAINCINLCNEEFTVSRLAEKVCLSQKQLQRIFSEHVGASPKEFMRIVRFHKALYTLQNHPEMNFTTLAYECGYYDQAHMINEFKLFSGYTPAQYIALCSPYSDYFSL